MTATSTQPDPAFFAMVLNALDKIVPALDYENEAERAAGRLLARALFEELWPANAMEAATVSRMIAAHFAAMDSYARAAKPGMSDDMVIRLRGRAIAASRLFDAQLQLLPPRRPRNRVDTQSRASDAGPVSIAFIPEPASNVRHRAKISLPVPHLGDGVLPAARRSAWRGGMAFAANRSAIVQAC
jgi:hypothetical protein